MTAFTRNPGLIGDYTDVVAISMDLHHLGATNLELRLQLGAGADVVVTEAFSLSAMSGWTTAVFDVRAQSLTAIGAADIAEVRSDVPEFRIMHSPEPVGNRSTPTEIEAQLGIDNVSVVVPEPATALLLVGGLSVLAARRRAG